MILGDFELFLLNHVRELGPITPTQLHRLISDEWHCAFSSLATAMRRLERKGLLVSSPIKGTSLEYRVDIQAPSYQQMAQLLANQLVDAFGDCECPDWCKSNLKCSLLAISMGRKADHLSSDDLDILIFELAKIKKERHLEYEKKSEDNH